MFLGLVGSETRRELKNEETVLKKVRKETKKPEKSHFIDLFTISNRYDTDIFAFFVRSSSSSSPSHSVFPQNSISFRSNFFISLSLSLSLLEVRRIKVLIDFYVFKTNFIIMIA